MRKRLPFGSFLPDIPPSGQVIIAENVLPSDQGWSSVPSFQAITPALPNLTGGAAFVASNGATSFLAGDSAALYRYSGSLWTQVFAEANQSRWNFTQFGDHVVAVNGGAPVKYDLLAGTAGLVGGNPPNASLVATVRDFVVLSGDSANRLTVTWSGLNNFEQWNSTDNQSDSQQMLDGGEVMGLVGGEYGIILQRGEIKRMSYVGNPLIFQIDTLSPNIGCMAKGSVAQAGRNVFFLSERGFMRCNGNDVVPIGTEKVDKTFFRTYSRQDIELGIYAAIDPRRNVVHWSMPGTPGTVWSYNWALDRWSTLKIDVRLLFAGFTANVSIDALGNLDALTLSLDDPSFAGGNPLLLVANTAGVVGTLSGRVMDARIGLARFELAEGRARLRTLRPVSDAAVVTATIGGSPRPDSAPMNEPSIGMRANGDMLCRVNAREFTPTLTFSNCTSQVDWTYATAVDVEWEDGGRR